MSCILILAIEGCSIRIHSTAVVKPTQLLGSGCMLRLYVALLSLQGFNPNELIPGSNCAPQKDAPPISVIRKKHNHGNIPWLDHVTDI